jgi:hypothetical protein
MGIPRVAMAEPPIRKPSAHRMGSGVGRRLFPGHSFQTRGFKMDSVALFCVRRLLASVCMSSSCVFAKSPLALSSISRSSSPVSVVASESLDLRPTMGVMNTRLHKITLEVRRCALAHTTAEKRAQTARTAYARLDYLRWRHPNIHDLQLRNLVGQYIAILVS